MFSIEILLFFIQNREFNLITNTYPLTIEIVFDIIEGTAWIIWSRLNNLIFSLSLGCRSSYYFP